MAAQTRLHRAHRRQQRHMQPAQIPAAAAAAALLLLCLQSAAPAAAQQFGAQQTAAPGASGGASGNPMAFGPAPNGLEGLATDPVSVNEQPAGNRLGFSDRDTLPPNGGYALYNFQTKEPGLGIPDVLLTVKASPARVALYCNPSWVTLRDEENKIAGPLNAVWQFESNLPVGNILLSADNPIARPPEARIRGTPEHDAFVPSYNCTIINYDTDMPAHYTITATFNFHDVVLDDQEQNAFRIIWNEVCRGRVREAELAVNIQSQGLLDPEVAGLTCGQWVAINEVNGKTPYTDFCNVIGNSCNADGQLTQFNMDGWNLGGTFPMEELARFRKLTELDLSNNPNMRGDLKQMFNALSTLTDLQVVEVSGNNGFAGTFGYEATPENNRDTPLCQTVEGGLRILNMRNLGLDNLALPDCLLGPHSTLEEVRLGGNDLVGTIPDNFDASSPLQYLSMRNNSLSGTIPSTLGLAPNLATLDLVRNELTGGIPANIGRSNNLRFLHLGYNQLTGGIPSDIALHPALEALDVRDNQLSGLPDNWFQAGDAVVAKSPLSYVRIAENNFSGEFPETLARLPKLAVLDMENNAFTGELPSIKGMFTALRFFDASGNALTGRIPEEFSSAGVVRLRPTEAARINQFTPDDADPQNLSGTNGRLVYQQVFNVSGNNLSGELPIWLYNDNVPSWAKAGIDIHNNNLTVDCSQPLPDQLTYMTKVRACPQFPSTAALTALDKRIAESEGIAAPEGAAPLVSPVAAPAVVAAIDSPLPAPPGWNAPGPAPSIAPAYQQQVAESNSGSRGGPIGVSDGGKSGGLPGWGIAVVVVGAVVIFALAALLGAVLLMKRGPGHQRGFISQFSPLKPSGFSKFVDEPDMENGRGGKGGVNSNVQLSGRSGDLSPRTLHFGNGHANSFGAATNGMSQRY